VTVALPPFVPLLGELVSLVPLARDDVPELHAAIGGPEVFAGGWGGGPAGHRPDRDEWVAYVRDYLPFGRGHVHGVRRAVPAGVDPREGELVGTTTLGEFSLPAETAHVGWTAYAPSTWGTGVNVEAKLLVLGAAFDAGLGRVHLQADVLNERSRAAILRLGATAEGVLRRTQRRADGTWRDTAVYSVLRDEWPEVRAGLVARLAARRA